MKTIIRFDWTCQTMAIAFIFLVLIMNDLLMAWTFMSCLQVWQMISAAGLLAMNDARGPRRWLFLGGWLGYSLSIIVHGFTHLSWLKATLEIVIIALPVILTICYWLLTTCNLYPTMKYHKGKFLPHTSF